ncbi:MAG: elongation factor Ts [Bradymonadia bacterium]|jgi:elongation factor Ts
MSITAKAVKELRERTGAGMMDCKKALVEVDGDFEKAVDFLQVKGIAKAAKKASRVAAEGLVAAWVSDDNRVASLVEVNCETDFVALNDEFIAFTNDLAAHVGASDYADLDALLASAMNGTTVADTCKAKIASIGENISVRRFRRVVLSEPGNVSGYIHTGGRVGVLVTLNSTAAADVGDAARDIAMHVAAMNPAFGRVDEVSDEIVERERRVLTEQAAESGKPPEIIAKMIEGRLKKWKKEICLLDQPFVKDGDISVAQFVTKTGKDAGVGLEFSNFVRFERGEGIEKVETNLADEVAALRK